MYPIHIEISEEAGEFLRRLPLLVQKKFTRVMERVANGDKDREIFKKLEGSNIWEFRVSAGTNAYRLFAFWARLEDGSETIIVTTHGILKKDDKTPRKDINRAEYVRSDWFENHKKH